jgi:Uma2 family endonuclease
MAGLHEIDETQRYTYTDYLTWPEDFRAEIIEGKVYAMAPPVTSHQRISRKLLVSIGNFLEGKKCEVFAAPFGVRLFPRDDLQDNTVVEPDILVICDKTKIDERGCNGAPDLIIEILSPSTASHDCIVKFNKYLKAGVREYWIVDGENHSILVHILEGDRYIAKAYTEEDGLPTKISVTAVPGCEIESAEIFAE